VGLETDLRILRFAKLSPACVKSGITNESVIKRGLGFNRFRPALCFEVEQANVNLKSFKSIPIIARKALTY